MAINYLDIIGEYYPDANVWTAGNPEIYADLVWETAPILQTELDAVYLIDYKTQKLIYFGELAEEEVISGFDSNALGTPHKYDSEPEDQLNLIGSVSTQIDTFYACRAYLNGYQIVDLGGAKTGTDPTGFANNTNTYDCEIRVDGVSKYLSIEGQNAQTIDEMITEINNDADFGAAGYAELEGGNIKIASKTYNDTSSVLILDADLFNQMTDYASVQTAVPGENASDSTKDYRWHTNAQLVQVTQDGANVKLTVLQKFNVKKQQILNAADIATVDLITWD